MMLRCKEVVEQWASDAWRHRPPIRRLGVLMHLLRCSHCLVYVRQLRRIGATARRLYRHTDQTEEVTARMAGAVREAGERVQPLRCAK